MDVGPEQNRPHPTLVNRVKGFLAAPDATKFAARYYTLKAQDAASVWPVITEGDDDGLRRSAVFALYSAKLEERSDHIKAIVKTLDSTTWRDGLTDTQALAILDIARRAQSDFAHLPSPAPPPPPPPPPALTFDDLDCAPTEDDLARLFQNAPHEVCVEYLQYIYALYDDVILDNRFQKLSSGLSEADRSAIHALLVNDEGLRDHWVKSMAQERQQQYDSSPLSTPPSSPEKTGPSADLQPPPNRRTPSPSPKASKRRRRGTSSPPATPKPRVNASQSKGGLDALLKKKPDGTLVGNHRFNFPKEPQAFDPASFVNNIYPGCEHWHQLPSAWKESGLAAFSRAPPATKTGHIYTEDEAWEVFYEVYPELQEEAGHPEVLAIREQFVLHAINPKGQALSRFAPWKHVSPTVAVLRLKREFVYGFSVRCNLSLTIETRARPKLAEDARRRIGGIRQTSRPPPSLLSRQ